MGFQDLYTPSTTQASTAPEKKVKPNPKRTENIQKSRKLFDTKDDIIYPIIPRNSVIADNIKENLLPLLSAKTPVGISKRVILPANTAFKKIKGIPQLNMQNFSLNLRNGL